MPKLLAMWNAINKVIKGQQQMPQQPTFTEASDRGVLRRGQHADAETLSLSRRVTCRMQSRCCKLIANALTMEVGISSVILKIVKRLDV